MVVIDLFSGAGGLTEGFYKEGYEVVAHVEKEKWACETLKTRICFYYLLQKNDLELYKKYLMSGCDYKKINEAREIIYNKYPELKEKVELEVLNKTFGNSKNEQGVTSTQEIIKLIQKAMNYNNKTEVDVIIGGPPCQAYSVIGRARMGESVGQDKRNYLFYYYKNIVDYFKPKIFIFENVPGILTAKNGQIFNSIKDYFEKIGYTLKSGLNEKHKDNILNAADFGVYQNRKRMILFGVRNDLKSEYLNFDNCINTFNEEKVTKNAIGDLLKLQPGEGDENKLQPYGFNVELSEFELLMRENSSGIINHQARNIKDFDRKTYGDAIIKSNNGEKFYYSDLPELRRTHKNVESFLDRFKVHGWNKTPHTIVAHISKDGHYNIHPDINQCRSLTVREAARIQSFPDNFKFEGPRTWQYVQVGNAVPPLMAQAIAKSIKKLFIL
ncbi:DNA cytosine methyltransferase [Clostridium bowmanii]|uniref:DNA cytosine methyltransferase n=1 Tax=Clostridium bowmanii TaxID=132925 RepID=UPI001C0C2FAA|nr:DNA (cytosine-5-)-methyltransferase [Clostridium bowmanii]MBU3188330.1 DNA cytosine methyltransferase [Clostridium bowmanii]MCA1072718.1 DNA cytosine methyltransferase [Clostridium bowmanii]